MGYISGVVASIFSIVFVAFLIATIGYLVGAIEIKGISLGTAGVLLVAILYGILVSKVPEFTMGDSTIVLFDDAVKSRFSMFSSLGTAMFVTAVGLIAGPKFFRNFNKSTMGYVYMGIIVIAIGSILTGAFILLDKNLEPGMAVGIMTGALTSTPGLSAAKEVAGNAEDLVTAGYGIAYLYGVLGVVFFVQLMPKILKVDMDEERRKIVGVSGAKERVFDRTLKKIEPLGFLPFFLSIAFGCILGAFKIPGINFSLGNSGGCLVAGLIVGHFGHIGSIDLRIGKTTLNFMRELGLVFFLIGAGVPGGVNFVNNIKLSYFIYGILITTIPMLCGYFLATKVFKIDLLNSLGSITGGMTSTPALGALIATAETDEVAGAYAATYPVALVCVVIMAKVLMML